MKMDGEKRIASIGEALAASIGEEKRGKKRKKEAKGNKRRRKIKERRKSKDGLAHNF